MKLSSSVTAVSEHLNKRTAEGSCLEIHQQTEHSLTSCQTSGTFLTKCIQPGNQPKFFEALENENFQAYGRKHGVPNQCEASILSLLEYHLPDGSEARWLISINDLSLQYLPRAILADQANLMPYGKNM